VHKATRRIKLLDSVVESVSRHDGAIRGTTHALWIIKLTLAITRSTMTAPDGVEWLVATALKKGRGKRENLNTVVALITHQEVIGEGLDAKAAWVLELAQLTTLTSHRVEMLQVSMIEDLDAIIAVVRDEDSLVLVVKSDAPWTLELASRVASLSIAK
jgi:hypothetical protein